MPDETVNDSGDRSANQPEPAATTPEPTPAPASAASATLSSPWADDLRKTFDDPAVQAQVDGFLRETVQPHVTKLEQATVTNRRAEALWNDFMENPQETLLSVTEEIVDDPDRVAKVKEILAATGNAPTETPSTDSDFELNELPPEVREAVEFYQSSKSQSNWDKLLTQLKQDNPDVDIDEGLFAPFVNAADGDVELALNGYKQFISDAKTRFGGEAQVPEGEQTDTPPAVIGSENISPTGTPEVAKPATVGEAIDELWDDMQRAKAPTTVGQI